jgi:hypothetical protein
MSLAHDHTIKDYLIEQIGTNEEDDTAKQHLIRFQQKSADIMDVAADQLLNLTNIMRIQNMFNPQARLVSNYLYLSGSNRSDVQDGTYKLHWYLNSGDPIYQKGVINLNYGLRDIVSMKIQKISFGIRNPATSPILARKRVAVDIEEFNAQACISPEGTRFHFMMDSQGTMAKVHNDGTSLSPYNFNRGVFHFRRPIGKIDAITLSMYTPLQPLALDSDYTYGTVVQGSNPATIIFTTTHDLYAGPITISGFTTGNPVADAAIIAQVNTTFNANFTSCTGPLFTLIDDVTITLPVDLSSTTPLPTAPTITMYAPIDFSTVLEIISLRDGEFDSQYEEHI